VPNPQFVNCLRANSYEPPQARATVIRGRLNDTLILDLDGIKPGLAFDLFTVQRSPFLADGSKDPNFKGSFGLAWYQSDIQIGKHTDDGHVRIKTILLDQIFGFDPDVFLRPTNTFHVVSGLTTLRTRRHAAFLRMTQPSSRHSMASTKPDHLQ
jgi:hypothetical protein